MKKLVLLAAAALMTVSASAQTVQESSGVEVLPQPLRRKGYGKIRPIPAYHRPSSPIIAHHCPSLPIIAYHRPSPPTPPQETQ